MSNDLQCRQGDEYDDFEVDASHFNGDGLLLMALSRVRKLSGLKLKGCSTLAQMKFKAAVNWRVVHEMAKYFILPPLGVKWAAELHNKWVRAWEHHERKRERDEDEGGQARVVARRC